MYIKLAFVIVYSGARTQTKETIYVIEEKQSSLVSGKDHTEKGSNEFNKRKAKSQTMHLFFSQEIQTTIHGTTGNQEITRNTIKNKETQHKHKTQREPQSG